MSDHTKLDSEIIKFIDECREKEHADSYLIAVLHKIQGKYGYLSDVHMHEVAQRLQVPSSTVSGVATFYHFFRLQPKGKYHISLCLGTACFVKGADKILEAFRSELGIELGETTSDKLFSLECSRCLGVCALAPVVTINDQVYSKVSPTQAAELINKARFEEAA
ncbi:MAG: NADH-quinone oxidoreductase subunit NuoE [Calditrichaeota bacterium]|nr:MAG: NADH-quinone oxidoreductase subunit NuoE [Calditrichota bacterium]